MQVRRLYEEAEKETAEAMERLVNQPSFGRVLALMTENAVALAKIGMDVGDLVLRNLRLAGRADIVRLSRQLNRTEDKLELVLQEVEALRRDQAAAPPTTNGAASKPQAAKS
jgi:hypothetical protein